MDAHHETAQEPHQGEAECNDRELEFCRFEADAERHQTGRQRPDPERAEVAVHRVDLRAINVLGNLAFKTPSIGHEKSARVPRDGAPSTEFLSRNAEQAVARSRIPSTGPII